jgi:hypothetical protein
MHQTPALMKAHRLMCKERDDYESAARQYEELAVDYRTRAQEIDDILGSFEFIDGDGNVVEAPHGFGEDDKSDVQA